MTPPEWIDCHDTSNDTVCRVVERLLEGLGLGAVLAVAQDFRQTGPPAFRPDANEIIGSRSRCRGVSFVCGLTELDSGRNSREQVVRMDGNDHEAELHHGSGVGMR